MSAEGEALHAVLADDREDAERILAGLLPGELRVLAHAARSLAALCEDMRVLDGPEDRTGEG